MHSDSQAKPILNGLCTVRLGLIVSCAEETKKKDVHVPPKNIGDIKAAEKVSFPPGVPPGGLCIVVLVV